MIFGRNPQHYVRCKPLKLRPESIVALEKLLDILRDNPHIIIELSSHTDYRVGRISNEELSQLRAQSVVNF